MYHFRRYGKNNNHRCCQHRHLPVMVVAVVIVAVLEIEMVIVE
jgi:hypothetical protein